MADLDAIFKAYDVRGLVGDQIDADVCHAIGGAFARFAKEEEGAERILVGRDMRPSGVQFAAAFAEGAQAQGVSVVDIGLCSTDMVYFASGLLKAPGAMFTASHNPAAYNGIKFCLGEARAVGQDTGLDRIKAMARDGVPQHLGEPGALSQQELLGAFVDHVRSFVDTAAFAPLKIVADTANGMGGLVVPAAFAGLPVELEVLYPELDGTFPNHPADPIQVENQQDLIRRVLETGADIGLAFDGDADRVFVVDDQGEPISGSTTTAMVASGVLEKEPGATILHNLICSKAVPEIIREKGGTPIRTQVGHSLIKAVMAETGAAFGGEHSAHYYFRDNWRADSGLIAAMHVIEGRSKAGVPLSEMRKPFDRYAMSGEINTTVDDPLAVIERVAAAFPDGEQDRLDGLTVDLGPWWFNLRPSNTEPLLRLNLEAPTRPECDEHVAEVLGLITGSAPAAP
ncbi:MAG TPA: phosphomannomutase/phosphoglucomutase [Iamia sp.]